MNGNYGRTDEIMPLNKAVKTSKKALFTKYLKGI